MSSHTINNKSSLSKQVSRPSSQQQHPITVVSSSSSSSSSDETFKKLIFMTKEYRKMRFELERISNIAIQQHEQMKQQQFTIENMHLYIVKQRDELLQLNSQIKMEKELCEDVIRLKQQESSSSTYINNQDLPDNSSSVNDDLMTMMMMGDDDSAHQEEVKQMMNRVLGGSNNDIQKYLLLMDDDDDESEDTGHTGGHIGDNSDNSDDADDDARKRRREQLTQSKTFMLEDKVAQLQRENHSLRSEVMQLKDSLFVLQQMEKHRNMATNNNSN